MAYDISAPGGDNRGARRLLALASHLETVAEQDYDHRTWRGQRPDGSWVMCALGHGVTALPDLIGLRWRQPGGKDIVRLDGTGITQNVLDLVAEAFDLTVDEAAAIFGAGIYTTQFYGPRGVHGLKPRDAAAAIRTFAYGKIAANAVDAGR